METTHHKTAILLASLFLLVPAALVRGQPADEVGPQPKPSAEQHAALAEIKKIGGMLVHYDDRLPGRPVTMIDATNMPGFRDEWTRHFAAFPKLRQIGLSGTPLSDAGLDPFTNMPELEALLLAGTKISDAGLAKLAGCKQLRSLSVGDTSVTQAGIASLRKALPQLEIAAEPEKLRAVAPPAADAQPSEAALVARFTAQEIRQWREKLVALSRLPAGTPNGWAKSPLDPNKLLTVFPRLRVRKGYVLRAYVFVSDGNSNGFVWAVPAAAEFLAPDDCPRLESHALNPPKPFDALDDVMDAIEGDDSLESYFQASILRRELKEFGAGWHGISWGENSVLDDNPWKGPPPPDDGSVRDRPASKREDWKWAAPQPMTWVPEAHREGDRVVATFYSYTPLAGEIRGDAIEMEKERIIRHTETFRRGIYRPRVVEKKLAEGPNAIAH